MLKITMLLLTTLSVSCVKIPYGPLADISFQFNRCRIRCYDFNNLKSVEDSKCGDEFVSGNFELEACEGYLGVPIKFFAEELEPAIKFNKRQCSDD